MEKTRNIISGAEGESDTSIRNPYFRNLNIELILHANFQLQLKHFDDVIGHTLDPPLPKE